MTMEQYPIDGKYAPILRTAGEAGSVKDVSLQSSTLSRSAEGFYPERLPSERRDFILYIFHWAKGCYEIPISNESE